MIKSIVIMGFAVKITTRISILDLIFPHHCKICGKIGAILCERCKKDIIFGEENVCPICHKKIIRKCDECENELDATFMTGYKEQRIGKIVRDYKFKAIKSLGPELAEIIERRMPVILGEVVVVPLPTAYKHIRARGFDHTLVLARELAKRRGWECNFLLKRAKDTVQVGSSAKERVKQANEAYELKGSVEANKTYLLVDDVWTTGASMMAATKILRAAGAEKVMAAVIVLSRNK